MIVLASPGNEPSEFKPLNSTVDAVLMSTSLMMSAAAYWSFLLYNIRKRSTLLCKMLSYNSRFVSILKKQINSQ